MNGDGLDVGVDLTDRGQCRIGGGLVAGVGEGHGGDSETSQMDSYRSTDTTRTAGHQSGLAVQRCWDRGD